MNIFAGGMHRVQQIPDSATFLLQDAGSARFAVAVKSRGQRKYTCREMTKRRSDAWRAQIQKQAYALWEQEGRPDGRDLALWLRAEAEIEAARFANWPEHIVYMTVADNKQRHDQIKEHAYALWEREGRPNGRNLDHWLKAQAEIEVGLGRL